MDTNELIKAARRRQRNAAWRAGRPRRMRRYSLVAGGAALVCAVLMVVALTQGRTVGAGVYFTLGGLLALFAIFAHLRADGGSGEKA